MCITGCTHHHNPDSSVFSSSNIETTVPTSAPPETTIIPTTQKPTTPEPAKATPTALLVSFSDIPTYSGNAYIEINGNTPFFTSTDYVTNSFETYSDLDSLGRCDVAFACIGTDIMPTEKRGAIGMVKPSGWHTVRYDDIIKDYQFDNEKTNGQDGYAGYPGKAIDRFQLTLSK